MKGLKLAQHHVFDTLCLNDIPRGRYRADLAAAGAGDAAPAAVAGAGGMTSAERKARKAFESIGLKEQPGFKRIIINYGRQAAIEIASPSVHRLPATDYWVIFGNAIPVDLSRTSEAAKQFSLGGASPSGPGAVPPAVAEALTAAGEADAAEAAAASAGAATSAAAPAAAASGTGAEDEVDLSRLPKGIVEKDVDFVAEHAGVTRAQAVEALIEHKQVVPAAMSFGEAAE